MSHFEDDDPPIKTHAASKEYRDNFDRIFGEKPTPFPPCNGTYDDGIAAGNLTRCQNREGCGRPGCPALDFGISAERRAVERGEECSTCGAKDTGPCDDAIHETIESAPPQDGGSRASLKRRRR